VLPDVPTIAEFVPGYEASGWYGLIAPKGTPAQVIETLNSKTNSILADAKAKQRLVDLGAAVFTGSSVEFGKFIADEIDKWAKVIRTANITAE
jgi:tripartite-type tricarboxylate transporter receptor subunit TctC